MHNETSFNTKFLCFKSKEIEDFKNCKTMQILKNHNFLYAVRPCMITLIILFQKFKT